MKKKNRLHLATNKSSENMKTGNLKKLPENNNRLKYMIMEKLYKELKNNSFYGDEMTKAPSPSSVLLLMSSHPHNKKPCLILNKRSDQVRQPGDLCCPGGGIEPVLDRFLGKILTLPGCPVEKWPYWAGLKKENGEKIRDIPAFLATALRESFEEMRLYPFGFDFLGPLGPRRLVMFDRIIWPMAGWTKQKPPFSTNREVAKIIYICLEDLLNYENYGCYHLRISNNINNTGTHTRKLPCFICKHKGDTELLWGATYNIIASFLKIVFDFTQPDISSLPVVSGTLEQTYFTGNSRK